MIVTLQGGDGLGHAAKVKDNGAVATEVGNTVAVEVQNTVGTEVQNTVTTKPAAVQAYSTTATVTTTSSQVVGSRSGRRGIFIQNQDGAKTVYVRLGGGNATTADWVVPPGGEIREADLPYEGAIQGISPGGNAAVLVLEFA